MNKAEQMTYEDAIARIQDHNRVHQQKEHGAFYITKALDMAVDALGKQVPKKVNYEADKHADDDAYCPSCGMAFESTDVLVWEGNYCPECGQRLDWGMDGEENEDAEIH